MDELTLDLDLNLDLDLDLNLDLDVAADPVPDPMGDYAYTGDVEVDSKAEMSAVKAAFIERTKVEALRRQKATDSRYWFAVCFQSHDQLMEFLRKAGWGDYRQYVDGRQVAKHIGVELAPEPYVESRAKINARLANLAMEA